jgi:hypothetical protein
MVSYVSGPLCACVWLHHRTVSGACGIGVVRPCASMHLWRNASLCGRRCMQGEVGAHVRVVAVRVARSKRDRPACSGNRRYSCATRKLDMTSCKHTISSRTASDNGRSSRPRLVAARQKALQHPRGLPTLPPEPHTATLRTLYASRRPSCAAIRAASESRS